MPTLYFWAVAVGALGVLAILAAVVFSLLGMARRQEGDALPPFTGAAFGLMVLGAVSFIGSLLLMVGAAT